MRRIAGFLTLMICSLLCAHKSHGQTMKMKVQFQSGHTLSFEIDSIRKATFVYDSVGLEYEYLLYPWSSDSVTYPVGMSELDSLRFELVGGEESLAFHQS